MGQMGKWAFIVGFVICVVAGLLIAEPWMYWGWRCSALSWVS